MEFFITLRLVAALLLVKKRNKEIRNKQEINRFQKINKKLILI